MSIPVAGTILTCACGCNKTFEPYNNLQKYVDQTHRPPKYKAKIKTTTVSNAIAPVHLELVEKTEDTQGFSALSEVIISQFPGLDKLMDLPEEAVASVFVLVAGARNKSVGKIARALNVANGIVNGATGRGPGRPRKI